LARKADDDAFFLKENADSSQWKIDETLPQDGLLTITELTSEALLELVQETSDVLAIRVPNYYPKEICENLTQWAMGHQSRAEYSHEYYDVETNEVVKEYLGVDRIGVPFNSTYQK
jgi:hypothetical protein